MASDAPYTILVLGGTGIVGAFCLRGLHALAASGATVRGRRPRVVAAARSEEKCARLVAEGLADEGRLLDLDKPRGFKNALQGVDGVFFMNGYTANMMSQAKWFIDAAAAAGVQHFVHLSADVPRNQFVMHIAWHELVDSYMQVKLPGKWTILAPGYFTENIVSYNGRKRVNDGVVTVLGNPNAPIQFIACEDIGEVAARCLMDPDAHIGKTHTLLTEVATINQALSTISSTLNAPLRVQTLTPDETYDEAMRADPRDGGRLAYFACVRDLMATTMAGLEERVKKPGGRQAPVYPEVVERICGRKAVTIGEWARRNRHWFEEKGARL
ncbi:hypothetical protein DFJ74DRAFT_289043 [Hyaloraphidium curvatum]|nr:hypothetical protein DFJ74DRAFT_289043 [Hyaloraphidium curvatum]